MGGGGSGRVFKCFLPPRSYSECLTYTDPFDPHETGGGCYYPRVANEEREAQRSNTNERCRNIKSLVCEIQVGNIRWKPKTKVEFIHEALLLLAL